MDINSITGLLLAGGMGRRMGGRDKWLLDLDGQTMASRVIERLLPQVGRLPINANRNLDTWRAYGLPVVSDQIGGFSGPLAGMHAGLRACSTPWLLTVPCDSPFLPLDLVSQPGYGGRGRDDKTRDCKLQWSPAASLRSAAPRTVACTRNLSEHGRAQDRKLIRKPRANGNGF
jgi:molybdopterin-guanine dinucleotide biosynthesis protein A